LLDKTIEEPPQRTRFVDVVQGFTRLVMRVGLMQPATFDMDTIKGAAAERAGSDDFGDPWFEGPLAVLLEALEREAQLHEAGAWVAMKQCDVPRQHQWHRFDVVI